MDSTVDITVISFILQDEIFMNAAIFFITAIIKYIYDVQYLSLFSYNIYKDTSLCLLFAVLVYRTQ